MLPHSSSASNLTIALPEAPQEAPQDVTTKLSMKLPDPPPPTAVEIDLNSNLVSV